MADRIGWHVGKGVRDSMTGYIDPPPNNAHVSRDPDMSFPTPEEVDAYLLSETLKPVMQQIRQLVLESFKQPAGPNGRWISLSGVQLHGRRADYTVLRAAFLKVQAILNKTGWLVEWHSDQREGDGVSMRVSKGNPVRRSDGSFAASDT